MGAVMWEALSGQRLFEGRTDLEIFKKIRNCEVPPLATMRKDVPSSLIAVVEHALAKEPEQRYASAHQFAFALAQVMRQHSPLGVDAQQALGVAVLDARRMLGISVPGVDDQPTWNFDLSDAPPGGRSMEIEFSAADVGVDPLPLTKPKP
jgi:serine/threonine-protein kinase